MFKNVVKLSLFSCLTALALAATTARADAPPDLSCTLTDSLSGENPGPEQSSFENSTTIIYLVCTSSNIKKDTSVKAVWIATDTNKATPDNFHIQSKELRVTDDASDDNAYNGKFSLSRPDKGWPSGSYRVEVYVNYQLLQTFKFDIS
jgi:hypothetical protein